MDEFHRVALAHPSISFLLHHNNNEVYNLKSSNLRQRIVAIFGTKTNEKLVPIDEQTDILSITGFVAKPEFAKYFLYLKVPAGSIDINIHPTKTEIKFDNEKALYAILRATVKHSLGQYNVAPVLDFNRDATLDTPYTFKDKPTTSTPKIIVDPSFNPFKTEAKIPKETSSISKSSTTIKSDYKTDFKKDPGNWEALYSNIEAEPTVNQEQLFESKQETQTGKTFQIQKKYILSTIKSGVVLIHQSLAHQRILYEEFLTNITVKEMLALYLKSLQKKVLVSLVFLLLLLRVKLV